MNNTSHTNIGRSRLSIPLKALSAFLAAVMFFWPVAPVMGRNLPSGWNVVKGQVTVTVNGKTMTVDQATAKAIVNWDSFDVGKGYTVDINQISTKAAMLARVVGANASEILGSLKATGGLYLVNPNGILFGSGAVIDVNRLIASTYDISNDDFWSGNLKFQGDSGASVVNRATINAESAALIGKNVENYGTINASQAALVGAAGPVKLDNFGNGANLSIDFSGLTGAHDTKVVNEGTINAAGGEAILTAEAGKGLVEAHNGTVVASSAEFSGKNSAPSNLGNLTADRILLDPEGSIVIGSLQAGGYKGKDGTKYAEYHPKAGGEIPPTFDAPYSSSSNAECTTSNMTVYDKDGNGWTYTYSTEDVTDPLTGATRVQYNYGTPVCTYYNSKYLSGHLQTANWGFSYTSGGGWAGDVTFTRGEGENLEQIMIGGTFGLSLEAERNLGLLDYVHFNNPNDIKLQGSNLVIGDFASVEALGNVSIIANTALANTGRLDITTPKRVELFINGGESAFGILNITSFEDDIFLRTSNLNVAEKLALNAKHDIYATGEDMKAGNINFTTNAGDVTIVGTLAATDTSLLVFAGRDVRIDRELVSAETLVNIRGGRDVYATGDITSNTSDVIVNAGRNATLAKLASHAGDVTVTAKDNATLNGAVSANGVEVTAAEGDVVVNGAVEGSTVAIEATAGNVKATSDIAATVTDVKIKAGRDAELAKLTANGLGVVDVVAKNNATLNGEASATMVSVKAQEGDVVANEAITATHTLELRAGRDATVNGPLEASVAIVEAKNNALIDGAVSANAVAITATEGDLVVKGAVAANDGSGKFVAGQDVKIVKDGNVTAKGDLTVEAGRDITSESDIASTEGKVALDAKNAISVEGEVSAAENVDLMATDGNVKVTKAITSTDESVTIQAGHDVDVKDVSAGRALAINAGQDVDTGALTAGNGTLLVAAARNITVGDISATSDDVPSVVLINSENGSVRTEGINVGGNAYVTGKGDVTTNGAINADRSVVIGSFEGNVEVKGATGKDVTIKAVTGNVVADNVTANGADGTDPALRITAGRDIEAGSLEAADGTVSVEAKNNALIDGDVSANTVAITAIEGELVVKAPVTSTVEGVTLAAGQDAQLAGTVTAEKDATITAGRDIAATADITSNNGNIAAAAGRDASFAKLIAENGEVTVNAKNSATLGAITTQNVNVFATDGDITLTEDLTAKGINLAANSGNVTTEALTATETDISVNAGVDATLGDLEAEGMVLVTAKNNATLNGTATGLAVSVTATEGNLKATGDVKSTGGALILTAGQDVFAAGLESELGNVKVTAGRDAAIAGETKGREAAEIAAGRDATTGAITADEDAVMVTAKNNATVKGAINGKGVMVAAAEGDANTGNIDAKSGHATVTAGQDATIGDVTAGGNAEIVAKRDATTGAITAADGSVTVVTKNNATIDGAINGRVVIVEAIEGDVSLKGDATASAGYLFVRAGQDAKVAADATLKSETSYVSVVAGRDALVEGALEAEDSAEVIAVRDATTGNLTAGDSVRIIAKNNATANGDINASDAIIRAEEGDASVNANVTTTSGDLILYAGHNVKVAKDMHLDSATNVEFKAGKDAILDGDITAEGGTATITATSDVEANGSVFAADDVTINAGRNLAVRRGVTSETGAIKMDAATGDMNINAPNGVTAAKEITLEAGIGNINIEGDSTIKGTDVTIHTATGNVTSGKNTTVEATTDNILVDASLRADMLGTLKAENGSVTVKAGLGATAGTVIAKDANIEANTGDIILEEDVTAGDISLDAKRGYVITKSLTATDDSITVNAGIDATLNGNLTAENGDVSVTAKNNAAITGTVTANEVTLTATEGDLTVGNDITANGRMATLAAGGDVAVAGGIKAPAGGVDVVAGRNASINGAIDAALSADVTAKNNATVDAVKGSHVTLTATDGTLVVNGDVTATDGDAGLTAGHDVEVAAGTTLSAAMDVNVKAGRDAAIEGAIAATVNARVNAGHDAKVGAITAEQGDAIVDAGSNIEMNGDVSANNIYAFAKDESLVSNGVLAANGEVILNAGTYMRLNNDVKGVRVGAVSIDNMFVDGNIEATGADIFLMSNRNATINGNLKANTEVHVDAIDSMSVNGTVDAVTGDVILHANNALQTNGAITAGGDAIISTERGTLGVYGTVTAAGTATIGSADGDVYVDEDVTADYIVISTNNGNASVSGNLTAEDSVTVQAGLDAKVDGDVVAKGDFIRVTGGEDVLVKNLTAENGNIKIIAGNNADLRGAAKAKKVNVEATAGTIASVGTLEATAGDITLKAGEDVNYLNATASGNITADAGRDIRAYGPTTAGGDVNLTARGNLMSNDNGVIDAEGDAKLVAKDGDVTLRGTVNAKNVAIEAGHDVTTLAEVTAEAGDVTVDAGRDAELAKLTANAGDVTVTAKGNASLNGAVNATTVTATATEGDVKVKAPVTATEDDVILTARRDVVINGGVVVAERDVLLNATDGHIYIGETVTANTGNVQADAGKWINVDASVEATEGDVNFKAASDVYIFDPVKAGKTIDIISLKGDVYTSKYGDLTAENGFIMVSALSGNVELAGDATAENGDVIINAGKDIDIHAPSNILAQNVNMKTVHGDVSNDGSIAAKGLEDSMVMVNANGNIRNTGSIQADKAVQLISTKDIRNIGSIQAGTATEKPLTPGSVIEFNADGKATSTGSLVAETITGLAADDITITGELNTDYLNLKTIGSDGDITVETGHDIIAASLVTEGDQSDISFNGKNVDELTAETKGTDADIDIKGGKMTIRKAVTFDGDVDIAGSGDLVLDVVEAKDGGKYTGPDQGEARHVNVTSGGMVKILTHVKADADVNIDARGPILDTDYAVITSGGDTSLTTGAYIGDVADGNPIHVEAEGTIYVNPRPGTPKVEYFAFVEGTSGDGQIHTKASSLPGLVIFNSVPWMGTKKQMGRLDRSYAEKFSAINGMLEVFNLSYPLVAEYRYFPHTILDLDGFTNAPRKGIEIIRMGGEKGGTINGLPEGLTPRNIPSVSDYEWTFLWPLDNEDADNAAEPVEATVSER